MRVRLRCPAIPEQAGSHKEVPREENLQSILWDVTLFLEVAVEKVAENQLAGNEANPRAEIGQANLAFAEAVTLAEEGWEGREEEI